MIAIYFVVAFFATTIGAVAGLGGGVIIKPILDSMGQLDISTISVVSAFTVFSMSIVSIISQIRYKVKIELKKTLFISFGSLIGGLFGDIILNFFINIINENTIIIIQNSILAIFLLAILIYMKNKNRFKQYNVQSLYKCFIIGIGLGAISTFLSIGGGPINVCIFTIFFSMSIKETAINSIVTIFFAQLSKIGTVLLSGELVYYDLSILPLMILGGILGGLVGSKFNKILSDKKITTIFNIVVIGLFILNIYNIIKYL